MKKLFILFLFIPFISFSQNTPNNLKGGSGTWQQTLISGSDLTQDNLIHGHQHNFSIDSLNVFLLESGDHTYTDEATELYIDTTLVFLYSQSDAATSRSSYVNVEPASVILNSADENAGTQSKLRFNSDGTAVITAIMDSSEDAAPNVIGIDGTGRWHVYAVGGGGGGTQDLQSVLNEGSTAADAVISLTGESALNFSGAGSITTTTTGFTVDIQPTFLKISNEDETVLYAALTKFEDGTDVIGGELTLKSDQTPYITHLWASQSASTADNYVNLPAADGVLAVAVNFNGRYYPATELGMLYINLNMTSSERLALGGMTDGFMVYDTTLHKLFVYDGTTWQACW